MVPYRSEAAADLWEDEATNRATGSDGSLSRLTEAVKTNLLSLSVLEALMVCVDTGRIISMLAAALWLALC